MRIRYNRSIKASSDGRKWVNTELTQDEYAKFRNFLKKKGYKYETSGAGDMVHIEAYLNEAEIKEADKFLDALDSVDGACGKKSVKASEQADDIVMYWGGSRVYEGPADGSMTREIKWFLDDPECLQQIVDYCNSFGDPVITDTSDLMDVAATFVQLVGYEISEAEAMGDDVYISDDLGSFEIFPASQEVTSSVKRGRKSVKASYGGNVSASKIQKFIEDSIADLQNSNATNCRLVLDDDLCLYVGYSDGFDTEDGYGICAKIAERNDADWADFDYLNMPWNTYSDNDGTTGIFEGDVYDTDLEITPGSDYSSDAQWLADSYAEIRNLLDEGKLAIKASTDKRRSVKASEVDELEDDPFINALWEACDDVPQLVEINYEATEGIIFIFNHTTDDYEDREASLINSLEAAGYDAEYLANNGSNVIVLDVKEKGVNASVSSRKDVKASELTDVNGYAVKIHDMHDAMYDLLLFGNREDAEWASEQLEIISNRMDNGELDDYEYSDMISDVFNMSDDYIEEINFRTEIDHNDIWTAFDDSKWQIVNPVSVSLWL